jgi:hypothetical protein
MMHAVGTEDVESAGEGTKGLAKDHQHRPIVYLYLGEFRLEVVSDEDGRMEYTCNIVYTHDGIKVCVLVFGLPVLLGL